MRGLGRSAQRTVSVQPIASKKAVSTASACCARRPVEGRFPPRGGDDFLRLGVRPSDDDGFRSVPRHDLPEPVPPDPHQPRAAVVNPRAGDVGRSEDKRRRAAAVVQSGELRSDKSVDSVRSPFTASATTPPV